MIDETLSLKYDMLKIFKTIKMVSKGLYTSHLIENTIWLYIGDGVIGYISYHRPTNQYVFSIHHDESNIRKEFESRNEIIRYLKKDFISEFIAGLI